MNTTRYFVSYLKQAESKDRKVMAICYQSLQVLVRYLLEIHSYYPLWCEYLSAQIVTTLKQLILDEPKVGEGS
ncbi:hypothetical protein DL93DRAFT_2070992, partial [Clavulina sp. PMI_390]